MPVLLSADFSYNCDHLSEVFPGFLIRTTCGLQVLLFSTDRARCGQLMGTRCEPSRTCPTCMAIILQISSSNHISKRKRAGREGGQKEAALGPPPGEVQVLRKESSIYWVLFLYPGPPMLRRKKTMVFKPSTDCNHLCLQVGGMIHCGGKMFKKTLALP